MEDRAASQARLRLGAALFNGDHAHLADEVARIEASGLDFVHLDVFDGHFVSDLGFPPRTLSALRPLTKLPFEVHLAAIDPLRFIAPLVDSGVDLVLLHIEAMDTPYETILAAREHGVRIGVAATLGTPLGRVEPLVPLVDAVLLLSRVTGEGTRGATFNPLVLPRLRGIREMVEAVSADVDIQVAGGVNRGQVAELAASGATALALGAGLYRAPDMALEVAAIRRLAAMEG